MNELGESILWLPSDPRDADASEQARGSIFSMVPRPLPALTVEDLTAQLIWRVVGPLPWLRPRVHTALLWAGISAEAPFVRDIGASFGVSHEAVRKWLKPIRLAGPTTPLSEQQQQQLLRPSFPGDDHLARTRRAELFGLARPTTLHELITPRWSNWIRLAEQILAAVGPLTLGQLHAGVSNARRRQHEQVPADELGPSLRPARFVSPAAAVMR